MDAPAHTSTRRTDPGPRFALPHAAAVLLVVLAVLVAYLPAIAGAGFHYDDGHHVHQNPAVHPTLPGSPPADEVVDPALPLKRRLELRARYSDAGAFVSRIARFYVDAKAFSGEGGQGMYRPVLMTTYAVDHLLWRYRPEAWVTTNALIHAGVAVLVWLLALRLGLGRAGAFLSGMTMALHPVFSESVNYVSSRSESLAALLMLGALHLHLVGSRSDGGRLLPAGARWVAIGGAAALSMLALGAKETTALFCVGVAWLELVRPPGAFKRRLARAAVFGAIYGGALLVMLAIRREMLGAAAIDVGERLVTVAAGADPQTGSGRSILGNLLVQMRVVVLYLQLLVRPVGLSIDHHIVVEPASWLGTGAAIALNLGLAVAALGTLAKGRWLPALGAGWFWIFLAPSIIVPLNVVMNEHRLYLPGIALSLLLGAFLAAVAREVVRRGSTPSMGLVVAGIPLALFVPLQVSRSLEWHDDQRLWERAVEEYPESARAHLHLGAVHHVRSQGMAPSREQLAELDVALDHYLEAERRHATWLNLQLDLGKAWLERAGLTGLDADRERSLRAFEAMGEIAGKETYRWRMLRAAALYEWGRLDEALAQIDELKASDDAVTPIYDRERARILRRMDRTDEAVEAMRQVVAVTSGRGRVSSLLTIGWWAVEDARALKTQGAPREVVMAKLGEAEQDIGAAEEVAKAIGDFRPKLYMSRMVYMLGDAKTADLFLQRARAMGWSASEAEVRWTRGGRTPGVVVGTHGGPR